jgi:hypothetical protein
MSDDADPVRCDQQVLGCRQQVSMWCSPLLLLCLVSILLLAVVVVVDINKCARSSSQNSIETY